MLANFFLAAASSPGVYYAYQYSDVVGKTIVIILIFCSILTWSTMLDKAVGMHRAKVRSLRFLSIFEEQQKKLASPTLLMEGKNAVDPVGIVYSAGMEKLLEFYEKDSMETRISSNGYVSPCKLSDAQVNAIEAVLESQVSSQIQQLETRIGLLATLVSLSPFLGLFGTVWGVMMAFCGIAAAGRADFTALAPGVAGALLTTVFGLIVAIPSLIGYNALTASIRNFTVIMDNFVESFLARLKLEQVALAKEQSRSELGE